jgi:hypothetical protein
MDCSIVKGKRSLQRPPRSGRLRKRSRRAGPALPSYLALHHAGFSVPPMLPSKRWALTPPFHPCQTERAFRRRLAGFPARCHRASPSRRYILCGTFRSAVVAPGFSPASSTSPPGVTRRVALYPEPAKAGEGFTPKPEGPGFIRHRLSRAYDDGVRTFLPPSHLAMTKPAITRLTRQTYYT